MRNAFAFLAAARCFLHYRQGRDDNTLSYELQAEAASRGVGVEPGRALNPPTGFAFSSATRAPWTALRPAARPGAASRSLAPPSLRRLEPRRDWRPCSARRAPHAAGPSGARSRAPAACRLPVVAREGLKLSREAEE